ncbi:hypothetical protein FMUND_1284 [Fusarium mundagurra]|uniref:Uncharacterized protein n=1 Tax=Fusarium mundagurra TaxID=1567541 RepID=A0A8H5Z4B3_9HYPO|nr:hypothetical protein FMUND_1284 [Fusarium mundagurra]
MSLTTTPTSWLESLPAEILQSICGQFCHHCQGNTLIPHFDLPLTIENDPDRDTYSANAEAVQNLCALSLVSRRLRKVAQPILYHEFPSLELRRGRLEPFLRTIIARPDLATAVKTLAYNSNLAFYLDLSLARSIYLQGLEVLGTDVNQVWSSRCEDPLQPDLHESLQAFLFGYDANIPSPGAQLYSACAEILILLLSLLPNLTTLMVDGVLVGVFLPQSAFRVFGISSIKLRRLYATSLPRAIVDVAHDLDELTIGPRCQARQEPKPRSISYCLSSHQVPHGFHPRDLEKAFAFYKQPLHSFRFEMRGIKHDTELPRPSFGFLNHFRTTLQSLHLDFDVHNAFGPIIASFKRFTNLKDLFIVTNLIYNRVDNGALGLSSLTDYFPDNLEKLTLKQHCSSEAANLANGLRDLLVAMHIGSFPRLDDVLIRHHGMELGNRIYREKGRLKGEVATESGERMTIDVTPN